MKQALLRERREKKERKLYSHLFNSTLNFFSYRMIEGSLSCGYCCSNRSTSSERARCWNEYNGDQDLETFHFGFSERKQYDKLIFFIIVTPCFSSSSLLSSVFTIRQKNVRKCIQYPRASMLAVAVFIFFHIYRRNTCMVDYMRCRNDKFLPLCLLCVLVRLWIKSLSVWLFTLSLWPHLCGWLFFLYPSKGSSLRFLVH